MASTLFALLLASPVAADQTVWWNFSGSFGGSSSGPQEDSIVATQVVGEEASPNSGDVVVVPANKDMVVTILSDGAMRSSQLGAAPGKLQPET